jgi:hypothetical protein
VIQWSILLGQWRRLMKYLSICRRKLFGNKLAYTIPEMRIQIRTCIELRHISFRPQNTWIALIKLVQSSERFTSRYSFCCVQFHCTSSLTFFKLSHIFDVMFFTFLAPVQYRIVLHFWKKYVLCWYTKNM